MKSRLQQYSVTTMCRVFSLQRSGFYAWLKQPESRRAMEDRRLLGRIKQCWLESGCNYGYRNISKDLKDLGECCGKNRVYRLMRREGIHSFRGYRRHRGFPAGPVHATVPNTLDRQFNVAAPNQVNVF